MIRIPGLADALKDSVAAYIGAEPAPTPASATTRPGTHHAQIHTTTYARQRELDQHPSRPPELWAAEAYVLDRELGTLAQLTSLHGPWDAAQRMTWSSR